MLWRILFRVRMEKNKECAAVGKTLWDLSLIFINATGKVGLEPSGPALFGWLLS